MTAPGPSPGAGSGSTGPSGKGNYPPPNVPPVRQAPPPSAHGREETPTTEARPPTHWPLSIVVFVLFWFLFGAIAMYYSSQVTTRWRFGDVVGAKQASKSALIINLIGIGVGTLFWLLVIATGS
ncbi:CD225/dispanin family protein [Streptomyces lydicus]|uniref:CD225/dispanin family protein n=1 Tax=Streptomyces lydicus TaxID=47763 RepID=UPI0036FE52FC